MNHVLVSVLTPRDIECLPNVVNFLQTQKPLTVVIAHNPSLKITSADATREVDKEISDLEKAKADAAAREDYPAAAEFKAKIEDSKMKRQDVLRNGWKSTPESERQRAYATFVDQFGVLRNPQGEETYVESIALIEDTDHKGLLRALLELGTAWPNALPYGNWAFLHPQTVREASKTQDSKPPEAVSPAPNVQTPPKAQKAPPADPREARKVELMRYMKMKSEAKKYGISIEGRKTVDVVEEILAKEFPVAA
jgi:hypothetical protein